VKFRNGGGHNGLLLPFDFYGDRRLNWANTTQPALCFKFEY